MSNTKPKTFIQTMLANLSSWVDRRMRIKNINVGILLIISLKIGQVVLDFKQQSANLDLYAGPIAGLIILGLTWVFFTINAVTTWLGELKAMDRETDLQSKKNLQSPKTIQDALRQAQQQINSQLGDLKNTISHAGEMIVALNTDETDEPIPVKTQGYATELLKEKEKELAALKAQVQPDQ